MSMKWKFLMLAFAAFAFVACSDNDVLEGGDGPGGSESAGEKDAWLSLSITPARTRTLHNPDKETGKAQESKINDLTVVLFDGFNATAEVTNVVKLNSGVSEGVPTEPFQVSSKAKAVLVIVNNNTTKLPLSGTNVGNTYAVINKIIDNASDITVIGANKDNFMMTNASGQLEPQLPGTAGNDPWIPPTATDYLEKNHLQKTKEAAITTPLTLKVDRVAAKVRVYNNHKNPTTDPTVVEDIEMNVTDFGWKLNVTNKRFYPVSERTYTELELRMKANHAAPGTYTKFFSTGWVWSDFWRFGSYRVDPNYHITDQSKGNPQSVIANTAASLTDANYKANYNFYVEFDGTNLKDASGNNTTWNNPSTAANDIEQPETPSGNGKTNEEYCLENTQDQKGNYHAYTTHALIKAKVSPSHFVEADGTTMTPAVAGADFMRIAGGYYTYATLLDHIEVEMKNYLIDNTSSTGLTRTFNAYLAYLKAKPVASVDEVDFLTILSTTVGTNDDKAAAVKTAFGNLQAIVTTHGADTDGVTYYYKDAISYYKVMIKHDNDKDDDPEFLNQLGEFGVVRNSVYDIKIASVKAPGSPILPLPDPDKPDEDDLLWLSIKIEINPWTWYTQEEHLGR